MKSTRQKNQQRALIGITVLVGLFLLTSIITPAHVTMPTVSVAAQGTSGGSGGGGSTKPTLPTDWPFDVPTPSGKLTGSFGAYPSWGIGVTVNGSYSTVLVNTDALYIANGYRDISGPGVIPYHYDNGVYDVQTAVAAHDHSNTSTDVTILVHHD
ncbi:MAG: hypothetical protein ABI602_03115 [Candidatus Saccharibacteria bacterium]